LINYLKTNKQKESNFLTSNSTLSRKRKESHSKEEKPLKIILVKENGNNLEWFNPNQGENWGSKGL